MPRLKKRLKDLGAFFADVHNGTLPAVSFIKPDVLLDSHPGTSTPPLFEGFVQRIIDTVQSEPGLWKNTAILITFDESGGSTTRDIYNRSISSATARALS